MNQPIVFPDFNQTEPTIILPPATRSAVRRSAMLSAKDFPPPPLSALPKRHSQPALRRKPSDEDKLHFRYVVKEDFPMLEEHLAVFQESLKADKSSNRLLIFRPIPEGLKKLCAEFGGKIYGKEMPIKGKSNSEGPFGYSGFVPVNQNLSKKSKEILELAKKSDSQLSEKDKKEKENFERYQGTVTEIFKYKDRLPTKEEIEGTALKDYDPSQLEGYAAQHMEIKGKKVFYLAQKGVKFNDNFLPKTDEDQNLIFAVLEPDGTFKIIKKIADDKYEEVPYQPKKDEEFIKYEIVARHGKVVVADYDLLTTAATLENEGDVVPRAHPRLGMIHVHTQDWIQSEKMKPVFESGFLTHGMEAFNPYREKIKPTDQFPFITPDGRVGIAVGLHGLLELLNIYRRQCLNDADNKKNMCLYTHYTYGIRPDKEGNLIYDPYLAAFTTKILQFIEFAAKSDFPELRKKAEELTQKMNAANAPLIRGFEFEKTLKAYEEMMRDLNPGALMKMQSGVKSDAVDGKATLLDQIRGIRSDDDSSKKAESVKEMLAKLKERAQNKAKNVVNEQTPYSQWVNVKKAYDEFQTNLYGQKQIDLQKAKELWGDERTKDVVVKTIQVSKAVRTLKNFIAPIKTSYQTSDHLGVTITQGRLKKVGEEKNLNFFRQESELESANEKGEVQKFHFGNKHDFSTTEKNPIGKNRLKNLINEALDQAQIASKASKEEVAVFILIANKNNGIASNKTALKKDLSEIYGADAVDELQKKAIEFSAFFQKEMEEKGIMTGNQAAREVVAMRTKRVPLGHAFERINDGRKDKPENVDLFNKIDRLVTKTIRVIKIPSPDPKDPAGGRAKDLSLFR
jgi:hypothetical protein